MNFQHPREVKKLKSWEPFWSYQLKSTANLAHLPRNQAKCAKLAVLFSWQLLNALQDFDFFNCHGCQTFILYEICYYLSPPKSWHNNSFLGSDFGISNCFYPTFQNGICCVAKHVLLLLKSQGKPSKRALMWFLGSQECTDSRSKKIYNLMVFSNDCSSVDFQCKSL